MQERDWNIKGYFYLITSLSFNKASLVRFISNLNSCSIAFLKENIKLIFNDISVKSNFYIGIMETDIDHIHLLIKYTLLFQLHK